ncbi:hypothetical protein EJ02DRAFT_37812 [Clathrospora elynae]|uniref:Uncharacterized protein n=1 Tax=Clathrospora elynae TaxID=706981 RepID=A0A6A5SEK3_9PLEO|nr:hypothetical protein EJ02DRAFT_37812 [Clathrospora elynae]
MTNRSLQQHQPKTTTISRRLRDRADQNLSVQPPEIPQIRSVRPRRAATLPTPHYNPIEYPTPESHPPSLVCDTSQVLEDFPRSNTSNSTHFEEERPHDLPLAQNLEFRPHESPQRSISRLVHQTSRSQQTQPTSRLEFLLPSVSGSHDFESQLSADPEQPHDTFFELRDMRYGNLATIEKIRFLIIRSAP